LKLRFTKRATAQITAALDYVVARSPQRAARIRDRLTEITTLLETHPYTATRRPDRAFVASRRFLIPI
jgi:plasmid stabilization system protein ParE